MINWWSKLSSIWRKGKVNNMNPNKFLIVGLGNIGPEYEKTRHNAGFMVVDALVGDTTAFEPRRYGSIARIKVKNKEVVVLKPSTFMNLSGNAVRYWMKEEAVPLERLLVIVDELALPFGELRLKSKGSAGGHNGLKHIETTLGTSAYARLRVGIGNDFPKGGQVDFVLSKFEEEEAKHLPQVCQDGAEIVKSFCLSGIERTMNQFNTKKKKDGRPAED